MASAVRPADAGWMRETKQVWRCKQQRKKRTTLVIRTKGGTNMYRIHRLVAATQHHRTPVLVATIGIAAINALLFLALSSRLSTSFAAEGSYQETNLSSDAPAMAAAVDPNLLNAGGYV
jgi:hypothetical protein